jgi:hypothetical protein
VTKLEVKRGRTEPETKAQRLGTKSTPIRRPKRAWEVENGSSVWSYRTQTLLPFSDSYRKFPESESVMENRGKMYRVIPIPSRGEECRELNVPEASL